MTPPRNAFFCTVMTLTPLFLYLLQGSNACLDALVLVLGPPLAAVDGLVTILARAHSDPTGTPAVAFAVVVVSVALVAAVTGGGVAAAGMVLAATAAQPLNTGVEEGAEGEVVVVMEIADDDTCGANDDDGDNDGDDCV